MCAIPDDELEDLADADLDQYFLVSENKIHLIMQAAAIRPTDRVVELGAGAGTVARHIPPCAALTLVDLDPRLIELLRKRFPDAEVIQGDALDVIHNLSFDVLISNLPHAVTVPLLALLPNLAFRTAILAMAEHMDVAGPTSDVDLAEVTTLSGNDFRPPQPSVSRVLQLTRRTPMSAPRATS